MKMAEISKVTKSDEVSCAVAQRMATPASQEVRALRDRRSTLSALAQWIAEEKLPISLGKRGNDGKPSRRLRCFKFYGADTQLRSLRDFVKGGPPLLGDGLISDDGDDASEEVALAVRACSYRSTDRCQTESYPPMGCGEGRRPAAHLGGDIASALRFAGPAVRRALVSPLITLLVPATSHSSIA